MGEFRLLIRFRFGLIMSRRGRSGMRRGVIDLLGHLVDFCLGLCLLAA